MFHPAYSDPKTCNSATMKCCTNEAVGRCVDCGDEFCDSCSDVLPSEDVRCHNCQRLNEEEATVLVEKKNVQSMEDIRNVA